MTNTVCLAADTLAYPMGGGHRWVYINWALGLRAAGCEVRWIEWIRSDTSDSEAAAWEAALRADLERHGLAQSLVLHDERGESSGMTLDAVGGEIDLVLTLSYTVPEGLLMRARRSAMIDIDPGLTQLWLRAGDLEVADHDLFFSTGTAARQRDGLPACGIDWHYTPPCVDVGSWPVTVADASAPYTTVTHWWADGSIEIDGEWILNSKSVGFEPFLELPGQSDVALELALGGLDSVEEEERLRSFGWRVADGWTAAGTTAAYASYIKASRGEFSCVKPSVSRLKPGWISDRTLCYLASGKPAVVQYSGELHLPEDEYGLVQFGTLAEAASAIARVEAEYERHSRSARALAESRFDAKLVATGVLEQVLA
jgi:hypothetical protein